MNKLNTKRLMNTLAFHIFTRFVTAVVLFSITLITLFVVGYFLAQRYIQYASPIYYLLRFIWNDITLTFIFIWVIGFVFLFFFYWRKTFRYIELMIEANNSIFQSTENLISLPSELKDFEEQLNQIKYDMFQNERAAKDAEQRKNDLVVYLAHDLKTPLTSVIGYLTLLKDEQKISEQLRLKYLSISLDKAQRLEDLINEFFEITRFNLTNITLELSQFNLTRMLEQISHEFTPMLTPKNLSCTLKLDPNLVIKADVNKLERVLDNLIRNAINYSFENSAIEIWATKNEAGILLKFHNCGNTIPEQKLNRLFEQFYRLDTARTSKTGGAGLGLAIAKEIIELHNGTISVTSANEQIRFEVFLPTLP